MDLLDYKRFLIVNHAEALKGDDWPGMDDITRPLSLDGARKVVLLGHRLRLAAKDWRLMSSPAVRAVTMLTHLFGKADIHVRARRSLYPVGNAGIDELHSEYGHKPFRYFADAHMHMVRAECSAIWEDDLEQKIPRAEDERNSLLISSHDILGPGLALVIAEAMKLDSSPIIAANIGVGTAIMIDNDASRAAPITFYDLIG